MLSELFCFIPGGKVFSVEADMTRSVNYLKKAIKEEMKQTLANVEANALIVGVDDSSTNRLGSSVVMG